MQLKRVGIFGGTFNPIHLGHLIIAQESLSQFGLEKIIFVPSAIPPHKSLQGMAPVKERLQMVKLAISGNAQFAVSDLELKRNDKSYTIETIKTFQKKYGPETELYFIIGLDALLEIFTWKNAEQLLDLCWFLVAPRAGFGINLLDKRIKKRVRLIAMNPVNISASEIRKRVKLGLPFRYFLPEKVYKYLIESSVYGIK
ncbi:MAG: nicotinate-nucleotide adenylyltransferase [bacterium]|nr:nicotinate-nucleotide adenylyltransferase [bacterium]